LNNLLINNLTSQKIIKIYQTFNKEIGNVGDISFTSVPHFPIFFCIRDKQLKSFEIVYLDCGLARSPQLRSARAGPAPRSSPSSRPQGHHDLLVHRYSGVMGGCRGYGFDKKAFDFVVADAEGKGKKRRRKKKKKKDRRERIQNKKGKKINTH
jgi:hypothetical protein